MPSFSGRPEAAHHLKGPLSFLNPTFGLVEAEKIAAARRDSNDKDASANGAAVGANGDAQGQDAETKEAKPMAPGVYHVWRSRDNRKGRHALAIAEETTEKHGINLPKATNTLQQSCLGIGRMFVRYPVWDVSYDVAILFTLGSVVWVINGFFVWLPLVAPSTEFSGEVTMGGGVTAFIGATIFEIGSVLLMLEAVNENRTECFGWALQEAMESRSVLLRPGKEECSHHHREKGSLFAKQGLDDEKMVRKWSWWPTWNELTTHYFREIGFLACLSQFIGATVFWICGFTGLPPIYNVLSLPATNGIYWLPQVVGGSGFIISSTLFMLETQPNWYTPAPKILGWHIGFWNLVGAIGFTLCGALGFASANSGVAYESALATFWGGWAFLIGSVVQWYESLDKYPVTADSRVARVIGQDSET